jgi:hypothetical protein
MNTRIGQAIRSAGRRLTMIALTGSLAGAVLATVALSMSAQASTGATQAGRRDTIAQLTSDGLRVTLTAYQTSGGKAPTATVRVAAYHRSDGSWVRYGRPLLVGKRAGWFWNVVTDRFGVGQFSASTGGLHPLRLTVRLLVSPAIGPSAPFRFAVAGGRLVAG